MKRRSKTSIYRWIGRHRRARPLQLLARGARGYLNAFENRDWGIDTNGERFVIRSLSGMEDSVCLFDVGAMVGDWTGAALEEIPNARVHCFEIASVHHQVLQRRWGSNMRVEVNDFGLGSHEGNVNVHYNPQFPSQTSVFENPYGVMTHRAPARLMTGDLYLKKHGIDRVDLVKIDVEGYEDRVLQGFAESLEKRALRAIQFEYGLWNVLSRFLLKDAYDLLGEAGFLIGKIYPNFVDFRPYDLEFEDFRGANYLAVQEEETRLIERLGARVSG
jgi:FkbM family methyltransferase